MAVIAGPPRRRQAVSRLKQEKQVTLSDDLRRHFLAVGWVSPMTLCSGRRLQLTACLGLAKVTRQRKRKSGTGRALRIAVGGAAMAVTAYLRAVAGWYGRSLDIVDVLLCTAAGPGATGGV